MKKEEVNAPPPVRRWLPSDGLKVPFRAEPGVLLPLKAGSRGGLFALDLEILILVSALVLTVLQDDVIGDIATAAAAIATRPDVSTPKLLPEVRLFLH